MRIAQLTLRQYIIKLARRVPFALRVLAISATITATTLACGWLGISDSVRFSRRTQRDLARLPETLSDKDRVSPETSAVTEEPTPTVESSTDIWEAAGKAEDARDWPLLRTKLNQYLANGGFQVNRNQAFDRLDALSALNQGAASQAVADYLAARGQYDNQQTQQPDSSEGTGIAGATATLGIGTPALAQSTANATSKSTERDNSSKAAATETAETEETETADFETLLTRAAQAAPALRDNVAYLRAANFFQGQGYSEAAQAFSALVKDFPRSEKREAAMLMAGLSYLKQMPDFDGTSGDVGQRIDVARYTDRTPQNQVNAGRQEERHAAQTELRAKCCSTEWQNAHDSFTQLLAIAPQSRYAEDARGWLGYLWLRAGQRGKALTEYYRLLSARNALSARYAGLSSLRLTRQFAKSADLTEVETALADEPDAALAYAYYDLYNFYTVKYSWADSYYAEESAADAQHIEQEGLRRLVSFASKMLKKYPNAAVSAGFAVRLAGAECELGRDADALTHARFALTRGANGLERARALLLAGAAARKLHNYKAAQDSLASLIREKQDVELTQQAQQLLALTAEDAGEWSTALEAYWAINYDADAAYLIDVLMTPAQLSALIEAQPQHPKRNLLLYSLGLRYLRAGQWSDARDAYQRIRTEGTKETEWEYESRDTNFHSSYNAYTDSSYTPHRAGNPYEDWKDDPKDPVYDGSGRVPPRLVQRDLQTVNDLERLERLSRELYGYGDNGDNGDNDARAEALYQYASYLFQSSTLLFYNPLLWHNGMRHYAISDLASYQSYHAAGEAETVWQYEQQHETIARALLLFLEVVDRYPDSRAAPDALYTAALCHERLSDYFDYWRSAYERGQHAGYRVVTLADVRQKYPHYRFPKGTRGWEPASRTVNGKAAWDAPLKPRPPLTRSEYFKFGVRKMSNWIGGGLYYYGSKAGSWGLQTWRGTLAPWLKRLALLLAAIALWRIARRTRRQLQQRRIVWPKHHTTPLEFLNWWRGLDLLTRRLLAQVAWLYALVLAVSWHAARVWW